MTATPVHLLNKTLTIQSNTVTRGTSGGPSNSWSNEFTGVRCRVQPLNASETLRYGRESTRRLWRFFVAPNTSITEEDRIVYNSKTMDIIEVVDLQEEGAVMRIIAEETEP